MLNENIIIPMKMDEQCNLDIVMGDAIGTSNILDWTKGIMMANFLTSLKLYTMNTFFNVDELW